jgi:hypothetical protein
MRWCAGDGYWKEELERLRNETDSVDADKAERLKAEGTRAVMDDNGKLLHSAARGLYALPLMQQTELNDIYEDAGLTHMCSEGKRAPQYACTCCRGSRTWKHVLPGFDCTVT